jgi:predicted GH43/DUF377 family glycosyl hydrolase
MLLGPDDFPPSSPELEVLGVLNPGAARLGDEVVLLVRVLERVRRSEPGYVHSPRIVPGGGAVRYEVDRLEIHPDDEGDYRKPLTVTGYERLAFISHLELVRLCPDGYTVREIRRLDALFGATRWEVFGLEDPRITRVGEAYWITYVGVSPEMGVATQLMSTADFETYERHGVIFPNENKDVALFPERIAGRFVAFHRPVGRMRLSPLAILAAFSPDMVHWGGHRFVLGCAGEPGWYSDRVGAGTPPVRTERGWLSIFHGVERRARTEDGPPGDAESPFGAYTGGALLTALDDPARPLAVSERPLLRAEEEFELSGYVGNVVFPSGIVMDIADEDLVHVYYGCADCRVAVATFSIRGILSSLRPV